MLKLSKLLQPSSVISSFIRGTARFNPRSNKKHLYKKEDCELVSGLISYYPRQKGEPEPSHEAPKLFRVTRIKPMKGQPHWDRRILRDFGLYVPGSIAIVKNIPENNQRLWKVKHLIRIDPITFPHGEPTKNDVDHTFLKENGECLVVKQIGESKLKEREKLLTKSYHGVIDQKTLRKDSRQKWLNPMN